MRAHPLSVVLLTAVLLSVAAGEPLPAASAAAPQGPKVFVNSSSKTDTPARGNEASTQAASWARALEVFTAEALADTYPCSSQMTPSDVGALLDQERQRQLLGSGGDPATMASIAGSIGARYLINIVVSQLGGRSTISMALMDAATAKTVARDLTTIPVDSDAADALEAFAKKFVASFGSSFPTCPGPWQGWIVINDAFSFKTESARVERTAEARIPVGGERQVVEANYSVREKMTGPKGLLSESAAAGVAETQASVQVKDGFIEIFVGFINTVGETSWPKGITDLSLAVVSTTKWEYQIRGGTFRVPATPDTATQSGAWSDKDGRTVKWTLKRPAK